MQPARQGDRVQVHYQIRLQNGFVTSSRDRDRAPLDMTVGVDHKRLPGLGLALVGLSPGMRANVNVPSDKAFGASDPARIHRWSRKRLPRNATLQTNKLIRFKDDRGRRRLVRILEISDGFVVVDANHRWAGQSLELEVELVKVKSPEEK